MRKAYTKPGLTRVNLIPSEAVLNACKNSALAIVGNDMGCRYSSGDPFMASCKIQAVG